MCTTCRGGPYANFDVVLIKGPDNNRRIVIRTKVRSISYISIFTERNWEYITYIILNISPLLLTYSHKRHLQSGSR